METKKGRFKKNWIPFIKLHETYERNQFFFISMATAAKFVLPTPIFLAYLVPLDVDVTGKYQNNGVG
jgi:hypothetical protein